MSHQVQNQVQNQVQVQVQTPARVSSGPPNQQLATPIAPPLAPPLATPLPGVSRTCLSAWGTSLLQYQHVTTRGRPCVAEPLPSVHPLVPLLLYSDRHFPAAPPFTAAAGSRPCCRHGNTPSSQQVKKPLNAFMLYMKEMRQKVLQEGGERESAAINRILGRRWNTLSPMEQSKYYDLAQKERRLHMQLYPGWSARENYGKRKRRRGQKPSGGGAEMASV